MTTTYYTPKVEEFHIGFEFEVHINTGFIPTDHFKEGEEWAKTTWDYFDCIDTATVNQNDYRVKRLDQQGLEDLGFLKRPRGTWAGFIDYKYNGLIDGEVDYFLRASIHIPVMGDRWRIVLHRHLDDDTKIDKKISESESAIVFEGRIKNKSELRRLMIQLGIIDNE
jgi:hypothetical protein